MQRVNQLPVWSGEATATRDHALVEKARYGIGE